jgi:hypothetical protein
MIVFDLKCADQGHVFEAWFGSSASYEDQRIRHLIACPLCGDTDIDKAVMAPNVGAKGNQVVTLSPAPVAVATTAEPEAAQVKALLGAIAKVQAKMLETSEWVGRDFSDRARAMDSGEVDQAPIHGQATRDEVEALVDDGIGVLPLLIPVVRPDKRN